MPNIDYGDMDLSLYGGEDPREIPAYSISEAAHHLRIPHATLRSWIRPRHGIGRNPTKPLIKLSDKNLPLLSFVNLVEAHILDALRYKHKIPMRNVRRSIKNLEHLYGSKHPLADWEFQTNNLDLFIEESDLLINVTQDAQIEMREVIQAYLQRVERDRHGVIARLYPFISKGRPTQLEEEPKLVLIDPLVSFGRPILAKSGIPTAVIAGRFNAGDSMRMLAADYGCKKTEIEAAIKYEDRTKEAA